MSELNLSQNQLTGMVPASLGKLDNVVSVVLWGNQLTGPIPDELSTPPKKGNLITLSLGGNQLTGPIPESLGDHTNLQTLYLWGNQLTGDIPDLSGLTALRDLSLSRNQLTGPIPDLSGSVNLTYLYLNQNQLTGEIPAWLGNLTYLEELYLWGNQLTGAIPGSLGSLTALEELALSHNQLTGEILASLGSLTALEILNLNNNLLTGEIPDLSSLTALEDLNLHNNLLTGAVPNFPSVNLLGRTRFANNALTGCVPHVLRDLVDAADWRVGSPAQDFIAVDVNGDGDTDDVGDVPGLNLPFCMLSALTLSGLDLDPAFAFGTMTYTAASTAASTTVTATRYESSDRLSVRKGATSYSEGDPIPLDVGSTLLEIDVTPTDTRLLKQTHTVDVFRAGSAVSDREALLALYNSAGGSGWTASDGWNSAQTLDTWHGVTVTGGRVVGLALAGNNLSGTVPASLSTLTKLTSLDLSYNGLSGAIPPGLSGLSQLTTLDLSANGLSGAIPPELGDLSSLDALYLHDNALSGAIPPELGNLSSLDALYLHDNGLSGAIPPELGNLSSLEELSLRDNGLSGPIPGSLGNLLALRFARFADNLLTGCVPHGLRYLVAAGEYASGVPAHDFARDTNRDGDTEDPGDIAGLVLPFCGLSQLTLGGLTLDPDFDDGTVAYIASAGHSVTSTAVTATLNGSSDRVSIRKGTTYMSGDAVPLAVGVNVITIAVTASDGTTAPHTYVVTVTRAPNTPPVFDEGGTATRGVDENTAANQPIGDPLTATDADNDTLTYSLDTTSDAFFDIDSGGQLLTEAGLDHEARSSYSVNVSVSDGKASDGTASTSTDSTITVTITVEDVDEPPLIVGETSIEFAENGTGTVDTYSASDPEGAAVTWLLPAGRDGTAFALSASGVLTFNAPPDHETQDMYEVILRASSEGEKGMQTGTLDVTVTVTNVNEPADISFAASGGVTVTDNALSVDENYDGTLATFSASDPERKAGLTYEWSVGGTDRLDFAVTGGGGVLSFAAIPDYELPADSGRNNVYDITVQATEQDDGEPLTLELTGRLDVTVTITNENERPVVKRRSGTGPFSIVENSATDVGSFVATDPEGGGVTWSLETSGDHGRFEIDAANGALSFKEAPDYESSDLGLGPDKAYTVTVQATEVDDGKPLTLELTGRLAVTVTITDENERPTISGRVVVDFTENGTGTVEMYSATDPDVGATQAWSLAGADGVDFAITDGVLTFIDPPDYDMPTDRSLPNNEYLVTVQVYDGANTATRPVTVRVLDVNEAPTVSGDLTHSVAENSTAVATYTATDPERATITWSVEDPGASDFTISNAGALSFASAPNYEVESSYTVTVRASDGTNPVDVDVTVTVTDVDEDEELKFSALRPLIGADYTAAFKEGMGDAVQSPTWVWARSMSRSGSGTDIIGATAATYRPVGDDRDNYLRVTVSYTDGHNDGHGQGTKTLSATSTLPTLPDIPNNMPPVFPNPLFAGGATGLAVDENATAQTVVGLAPQATDPEASPLALVYSLAVTGFTSDAPFEINATSRQIRVATGAELNHEDQDRYSVTVTAQDEYNATNTATFDITVEDVNERPMAVPDMPSTSEGAEVTFEVLGNDSDPDDGDTLTATIASRPATNLGSVALDPDTYMVTYRPPDSDFNRTATFTYTASDGELSSLPALVTVTVDPVNDAPTFPAAPVERSVSEQANTGDPVGAPVVATDVDGDPLNYSLGGVGADSFEIDEFTGQLSTSDQARLNAGAQDTYIVTVTADDGSGEANATATVEVTITVTARPVVIITGGGGGGGGGGGPTPSEVDFEWTVDRDIEELDGGNDRATGVWSDGTTLWVADNADGAGDAVYAYDLASGERVEEREFDLAETNRAPRGIWSDRSVVWVSDSGRERLFAYDLATGERLEEREFELAAGNSDARGIWSDGETMWVLDGRADALFAYALASGELLAEYALADANDDPRGIWSDGVTIWVSDHGAKRLIAYRLPVLPDAETDPGEEDADDDARELERVREEEFTELSKASNNSPRGIWSDGDVMYVADESDDRVYSYNMPDAIDARLASLTLSGVDIGEFDPGRTEYEAVVADGVTATTVEAEAMQRRTDVAIDPPDADVEADGHQVALQDLGEITVTVTSADGSRTKTYRVRLGEEEAAGPVAGCLRGDIAVGFSLVVYAGGSIEDLVACAEGRNVAALYVLDGGAWVSYIVGAPEFVNRSFAGLFAEGLAALTPLIARSDGPASPDPSGDEPRTGDATQPWPACLQGEIAEGFNLVVYEEGSVGELEACAEGVGLAALYALSDGVWVFYIVGAPEFVNRSFAALFADGVPSATPLVGKRDAP